MVEVSVIIATYNVENYIRRAIESALSQDGVNLEVIMVDDCSTDQTVAIASSIADPRLRIFRQTRNGGPSVSRNTAIAQAQGQWIAILDGDDAFAPDRLKTLLAGAHFASADIVVDNILNVYEDGRPSAPMFADRMLRALDPLTLAKFINGNQSFLGGTALGYLKPVLSRAFLQTHHLSYDPDIRIGEDYLLLASALACGAHCSVIANPGYFYTVRKGSISHRLTPADVERIQRQDEKFLSRYPLDADATQAQQLRTRHIREALAFTLLLDALRKKDVRAVVTATLMAPLALRYLWLPIRSRLLRLCDRIKRS